MLESSSATKRCSPTDATETGEVKITLALSVACAPRGTFETLQTHYTVAHEEDEEEAWHAMLPGGRAPSAFLLAELRAARDAHDFLTEKIAGPEPRVVARKRHRLSDAHVQMARELGMNPTKLGSLDNHRQERWKAPLPELIERLYEERFHRTRPEIVRSIEETAKHAAEKRAAKKALKRAAKADAPPAALTPAKTPDDPAWISRTPPSLTTSVDTIPK